MKIRAVGADLFHGDGRTDGRTDMTKLTAALRNFANAPKSYMLRNNCFLLRDPYKTQMYCVDGGQNCSMLNVVVHIQVLKD